MDTARLSRQVGGGSMPRVDFLMLVGKGLGGWSAGGR